MQHIHNVEEIIVASKGCGIVELKCKVCNQYWFEEDLAVQ
jgi:hypothetical protein